MNKTIAAGCTVYTDGARAWAGYRHFDGFTQYVYVLCETEEDAKNCLCRRLCDNHGILVQEFMPTAHVNHEANKKWEHVHVSTWTSKETDILAEIEDLFATMDKGQ